MSLVPEQREDIRVPLSENVPGGATVHVMEGCLRLKPEARRLVDRLWNYCNVLRDDGVSSLEYLEQLSFLGFLKMAAETEEANKDLPAEQRRHMLPGTDEWEGRGWTGLRLPGQIAE
ncbi:MULTISPECIES: type I restriction-modification system subunit M N-terminal domain-containing protein [unclassified Streptomyces]|uniref:type I restriction-modification system subunit M N-terminal domain-containing protein n=1 Tax=unclassified Streptomyces TaxID=2593676 RepID=UPI00352F42E9